MPYDLKTTRTLEPILSAMCEKNVLRFFCSSAIQKPHLQCTTWLAILILFCVLDHPLVDPCASVFTQLYEFFPCKTCPPAWFSCHTPHTKPCTLIELWYR